MAEENKDHILDLALQMGSLMLENGAETQRVQWTMEMMLSRGDLFAQSYVIHTGVFVGVHDSSFVSATRFARITERRVNLEKIILLNDIARRFNNNELDIESCSHELERVSAITDFKPHVQLICYGLVSMTFTVLFGGKPYDGFASFITGIILGIVMLMLSRVRTSAFLANVVGGSVLTLSAIALVKAGIGVSYIKIIIGALMPLVPGFAITSAARDMVFGDLLSGMSRAGEAVFMSGAITVGVLIILHVFTSVL